MARRSRVGFAPRTRKRAAPAWGFLGATSTAAVAADSKVLLGSFVLSNPPLGETILRTRAQLWVSSDQDSVIENQIGAFGMIVVTDRAIAAGAASIPGPYTDGGDDGWFVHQPFVQRNAASGVVTSGVIYEIDSKAMRKVEDGGEIAVMVENASVTHGILVIFAVRLLAKLTES